MIALASISSEIYRAGSNFFGLFPLPFSPAAFHVFVLIKMASIVKRIKTYRSHRKTLVAWWSSSRYINKLRLLREYHAGV